MLNLFKKINSLSEVVSDLNPLQKESKFQRLKNKLFPHQAEVKRRNRLIIFSVLFVVLNYGIYLGAFKDYESFAYNSKTVQYSQASTDLFKVREIFTSAFGQAGDSPFTIYSYVSIFSLVALVLLIEYVSLNRAYQYVSKKFKHIVFSIMVFIAFQALYLAPLLLIVVAETHVVDKLITVARAEVAAAQSAIANKTDPNIIYSQGDAVTKIASTSATIHLLSGDFEQSVAINYLGIQETDTFYRAVILPYIVSVDESFSVPHNVILFPNNNLVVSADTPLEQLEKILSTLALQSIKVSFVSANFSSVKDPAITFLEESKYNQIENKKVEARKKQYVAYLAAVNKNININNQYIKDTEIALNNLRSDKSAYEARVRPLLSDCISSYGQAECSEPTQIINTSVAEYDAEIKQVELYLQEARDLIPVLIRQYSSAKISYDQFLEYPVTPELQAGLFEPPSSIFIKYIASRNTVLPSSYYYTLLHELIHYYSYSPRDDTPTFIEEGVTDLLALTIGESSAVSSAKMDGYPQEIKIATRLFEMLGQEQATKLFLAKSKVSWQRGLDKVCGSGCYKKLESVGDQLTYTALDDLETRSAILNEALDILSAEPK
ncbi:hypothetical protein KBD69_01975 [Candidatus Woesebacteria bacterium]|nr:hypothetical protein [Candidatus Woesebacteria bacterium]